MASLTDNSIATVPDDRLHQLQERVLRQPEASHYASASDATDNVITPREATVQESERTADTSRSSQRAPPRLIGTQSAPAAEMEAMVQASPSQKAFQELTKASSFHGYPGGDTQPMESQVYRDFTESMIKSNHTTPKKTLLKFQISPDGKTTYESEMVDKTPKTCVEGDTCYVDLENNWEQTSPTARSESSHVAELLNSPETQWQVDGDEGKWTMPETPSLAGHKRARDGELLTSVATTKVKTPGFTQMFGAVPKGQTMTATQLFDQTQMPSSPIPGGLRSDPIMTRPSPNLPNQFNASSPTAPASSPVATRYGRMPASTGEPKEKYTSLRESQEQRAAKLRQDLGIAARFSEDIMGLDEDDEEVDLERRRYAHKRMQRVMSDNALDGLRKFQAPSRPTSRPTSSPKLNATIDLVTPGTEKRKLNAIEFDISEDGDAMDDERLPDNAGQEDDEASVDQYDELGQTVLRSQGFDDEPEDEDDDLEPMFDGGTYQEDLLDGDLSMQQSHLLPVERCPDVVPKDREVATQPSAIADSQPIRRMHEPKAVTQAGMDWTVQSSFVPGSQYSGKTSVDQAMQNYHSQTTRGNTAIVSSPLPVAAKPQGSTEGSIAIGAQNPRVLKSCPSSTAAMEVPESDVAVPDDTENDQVPAEGAENPDSNGNQLFSTARSHVTTSGPRSHGAGVFSPAKAFASQQSKSTSQTPRAAAGARHFAEIVNSSSPPKASCEGEDIDMVGIMSDIVTADDEEVMDVMASPSSERAKKRRKMLNAVADTTEEESAKGARVTGRRRTRFSHPSIDGEQLPRVSCPQNESDGAVVLQDRPSKANELRAVSPAVDGGPTSTPDSVKRREDAGAEAATRLLSRRKGTTSDVKTYGKKSAASRSRTKSRGQAEAFLRAEVANAPVMIDETVLETTLASKEEIIDQGENRASAETTSDGTARIQDASPLDTSDRVFALFKGSSYNNYYPARWLRTSPDGRSYRVRFEDTNEADLDAKHVRRLELRVGDTVKIDLPEMRGKSWVIQRMGGTVQRLDDAAIVLTTASHTSVHVQSKSSRSSGGKPSAESAEDHTFEIPVGCIYLTPAMWGPFADRPFQPAALSSADIIRPSTPSTGLQTPDAGTPSSRTRRSVNPIAKAAPVRPTTLREETVVSPSRPGHGIFSGMAFAISYGNHEAEKAEVSRLITRNGGVILENGFDELFIPPDLDDAGPDASCDHVLQLKADFRSLGFVALIADKHSRRAKYVQALALGLPTLSGRWLTDSLDASKNPNISIADAVPLPWSRYLLAAGESAHLRGAIRSRTLPAYAAHEAKLTDIIEERDILLNGDGVLIVASKKSKAVWERRKAYAFLTLALGASAVRRVSDLAEAKVLADGEGSKWKWVYVDGSVADASKVLFAASKDNKRKRAGDSAVAAVKVDAKTMFATNGKVKIVNDEFVIQSLILGALVDYPHQLPSSSEIFRR